MARTASNLVSLERVSKRYAEKKVLDGVTLGIDDGDRVGVIGVNGSGKSTLLRIVGGLLEPDSGRVVVAGRVRVAAVAQDTRFFPRDTVLGAATRLLGQPAADTPDHRLRAVLDRLGFDHVDRPVGTLSGGQRKRVALAAALARDAELLILDEPTNHLDVDAIEWLEGHLAGRGGALLLVTHDRYLLDRVASRIVELDRGRSFSAQGSYQEYLEARAAREGQAAIADRQRRNRARIELAWLRRAAPARTSKAKYRVEQAHALLDASPQASRAELAMGLPSRRLGSKVIELHEVAKAYAGLRGVNLRLSRGGRIGIVGPNGSGKTTLLRLLAGELPPDEGHVEVGETVAVGVYGQELAELPPRTRVLDAVAEVAASSAGRLLERFLFPTEAQKAYVEELSGGERRRLELLRVLAGAPNVLLLDEPTNDLDLDTLAVLEEELDTWPGVVVAASHDRFFLDRVCRDIFGIERDGTVRHEPGGWSAYHARRMPPAESPRREPTSAPRAAPRLRKLSYNEQRELRELERRLPQLEERKGALALALQDAGDDYESAQRAGADLAAVLAELETAEARWLDLSLVEEQGA